MTSVKSWSAERMVVGARTGGAKADCAKRPNPEAHPLQLGRKRLGQRSTYYVHTSRNNRVRRVYCDQEPSRLRESIRQLQRRLNQYRRAHLVQKREYEDKLQRAEAKRLEEENRLEEMAAQLSKEEKKLAEYQRRVREQVPNLVEINRQEDSYLNEQMRARHFYLDDPTGTAAFINLFRTRARILYHLAKVIKLQDGTNIQQFATKPSTSTSAKPSASASASASSIGDATLIEMYLRRDDPRLPEIIAPLPRQMAELQVPSVAFELTSLSSLDEMDMKGVANVKVQRSLVPTFVWSKFVSGRESLATLENEVRKDGCHLQWKVGQPIATRLEEDKDQNQTVATVAAQACHAGTYQCGYVLKFEHDRKAFNRELEMYGLARQRGLIRDRVVPRLMDSWWCQNTGHLVLERIDLNIVQLGRLQFGQWMDITPEDHKQMYTKYYDKTLLFTVDQLEQLWALAGFLDRQGLVHGDLKLGNILYRVRDQRLYIFDFGFSAFVSAPASSSPPAVGWTVTYGAPNYTTIPAELYPIFNRWQMLMALTEVHPILVAVPADDYRFAFQEVGRFAGFLEKINPSGGDQDANYRPFQFSANEDAALRRFMPDYPDFSAQFNLDSASVTPARKQSYGVRQEWNAIRQRFNNTNILQPIAIKL
jgi:hypothetical protein